MLLFPGLFIAFFALVIDSLGVNFYKEWEMWMYCQYSTSIDPVLSVPFVKNVNFFSNNPFDHFLKNQVSTNVYIYLWNFYFFKLTYYVGFVPVPHCFCYHGCVIQCEMDYCGTSRTAFFPLCLLKSFRFVLLELISDSYFWAFWCYEIYCYYLKLLLIAYVDMCFFVFFV